MRRTAGLALTVIAAAGIAGLAARPQLGGIVSRASQGSPGSPPFAPGRLTVRNWQALSADFKRSYAIGFADALLADSGMTSVFYRGFLPCLADLTDDQVSGAIASAIEALPADAAETLTSRAALRGLHTACPSTPR